jgi:threonine/homoserine/homoserine lactone efflux protein
MDLAGFIAVATLVVMTPGPDMTLVARNTFAGGRPSGLATSAGTCSGLLVHATAAALGFRHRFTWRLLALSGLFIVMGSVWLTIYTIALHAVSGFVGRPRVKTIIESSPGVC